LQSLLSLPHFVAVAASHPGNLGDSGHSAPASCNTPTRRPARGAYANLAIILRFIWRDINGE
jgi:hypothetical protein